MTLKAASFTENLRSNDGSRLYLVRGRNEEKPAWWFLKVPKHKLVYYRRATKKHLVDLADYGEILYSGWGENPPEGMEEKARRRFREGC